MAMLNPTPTLLGRAQTSNDNATTVVTSAGKTIIQTVDLANVSGGSRTVSLYAVPNAGAAGTSNALIYQETLASPGSLHYSGPLVLETGDTLQVQTDNVTPGVTVTVSGFTVA